MWNTLLPWRPLPCVSWRCTIRPWWKPPSLGWKPAAALDSPSNPTTLPPVGTKTGMMSPMSELASKSAVAITLPDGSVRRYDKPVTGMTLAADIGPGLAKAALAMTVNGQQWDLSRLIEEDATVSIITAKSEEALEL